MVQRLWPRSRASPHGVSLFAKGRFPKFSHYVNSRFIKEYIYIYIFDLPYLCNVHGQKKQNPFGQCHSKRAPRHLSRPAAYIRPCNLHGHLCIGVFRVDGPWGGHVSWTVEGCKTCATLRSVLGMVCGEQTLSFNNVSLSKEKDTTSFKF